MNLTAKIRQLAAHPGFVKYFKNTSWMMGERVLRMAAGLFVGIWVARYLGPDRFGLLSYAQSLVGLFAAIATLGLDGIVVRELVKDPEKERELLGTAFVLKLFGAFLTLLVLYIAIHFTSNDSYTNLLVFIIASGVIFQSFNVVDMYFQAKVMSRYAVFAKVTALVLSSIAKIVLILLQAPLEAFAWMAVFDGAVLATGYLYWYTKTAKERILRLLTFNLSYAKRLIKNSWPLVFSTLIGTIYLKIDQIMIKEIMTSRDVGEYAAAIRISGAFYFIPSVITLSIFPSLVSAKKLGTDIYNFRLQRLYYFLVSIAYVTAILISFNSEYIINLIYGVNYMGSSDVLSISIWSNVFTFLGAAYSKFLIIEDLVMKSLYRMIFGAATNIFMNLILIPIWGIVGAAISTIISQAASNYLYDIFDRSMHNQLKMKTKSLLLYNTFNYIVMIIFNFKKK